MNYWQSIRQLQYLLRQLVWAGSSTKVFNADSVVIIATETDIDAIDARLVFPACLLVVGAGQSDPEAQDQPDLLHRRTSMVVMTRNENDRLGQGAVVGAVRESMTDSRGRGALEVERMLLDPDSGVGALALNSGINIVVRAVEEPAARRDQDENNHAFQAYEVEIVCGVAPYYAPGRRLLAASRTGQISLSWANPALRFDTYRPRLIRKAGSTPPVSTSDGTELTLAVGQPAVYVDSGLSAGTYSYSLFESYDDFAEDSVAIADRSTSAKISVAGALAF